MLVKNESTVKEYDERNKKLYQELTDRTGMPMETAGDVASIYNTLKAEVRSISNQKKRGEKNK